MAAELERWGTFAANVGAWVLMVHSGSGAILQLNFQKHVYNIREEVRRSILVRRWPEG
jgi:hypothetical protein